MAISIKNASERNAAFAKAEGIVESAGGADLTPEATGELNEIVEGIKAFDAKAEQAAESARLMEAVEGVRTEPASKAGSGKRYLALTGRKSRTAAKALAEGLRGNLGTKGIVASGSTITGVPLEDKNPLEMQRIPTSLLDVLAVKQHQTPAYTYLRQTKRVNNAAPWTGGAKATSLYEVESVDAKLTVIAHLSDGLTTYDVLDNDELVSFVDSEMLYGLQVAVEDQILNGTGSGNNLKGILATAGTESQGFDTDPITTARKAITKLTKAGQAASVFVLSPEDWETISLQRNSGGAFDLGNVAVDAAAQRLHGVQVVISTALPAGTGLLLDTAAVRVDTDTHGVLNQWGTSGTDFAENVIRSRTEGRFGVSVVRPAGVVKLSTVSE
ncbi:MAG: phage major capsid protein [Gordonia sp. (in: high G+C Gram-positive bacteria)]